MFSNGPSFNFGNGDSMCLGNFQLEGAVRHAPSLHLFNAGPAAMIQKLCNPL